MQEHTVRSSFRDTRTIIYYYPSVQKSDRAVLILKGLYGGHDPAKTGKNASWDNLLVERLRDHYHTVLIRTGRGAHSDKQAQFEGKTFAQECTDVETAAAYSRENLFQAPMRWAAVALSFGGTTLLGTPVLLTSLETVLFVGSGCGRSATTTRPLLSTLAETDRLLEPIARFTGNFFFLHGGRDTVVPLESQKMLYENAQQAFCRGWIDFPGLNHELEEATGGASEIPLRATQLLEGFF